MSHHGRKYERTTQRQKKSKMFDGSQRLPLVTRFLQAHSQRVRQQGKVAAMKTVETEESRSTCSDHSDHRGNHKCNSHGDCRGSHGNGT